MRKIEEMGHDRAKLEIKRQRLSDEEFDLYCATEYNAAATIKLSANGNKLNKKRANTIIKKTMGKFAQHRLDTKAFLGKTVDDMIKQKIKESGVTVSNKIITKCNDLNYSLYRLTS